MKQLKKYFNFGNLLIILCILSQCALAEIAEKKCGNFTFRVKILNEGDIDEKRFKLYYYTKGQRPILFYQSESGHYLDATCVQNKKKKYLMLFQEYCGGSACIENIYGLFDPHEKKILINPSDWPQGNSNEIEKIISYPPPFYSDGTFFCCN